MASGEESSTTEADEKLNDGDVSPLRRSSRVSALRAVQRLKSESKIGEIREREGDEKERIPFAIGVRSSPMEPMHKKKSTRPRKRRLAQHAKLDPTDPHFIIQQTEDGEVVVLSDDSVVSSLNDDEIAFIKANYDKTVRAELTPEQVKERRNMIRKLQAELRVEEAKLVFLKKMRISQQIPVSTPKDQLTQGQSGGQHRSIGGLPPPLMRVNQGAGGGSNSPATQHQTSIGGYRQHLSQSSQLNRVAAGGGSGITGLNLSRQANSPLNSSNAQGVSRGNSSVRIGQGQGSRPIPQQLGAAHTGPPRPAHQVNMGSNVLGGLQNIIPKPRPVVEIQTAEQKQAAAKLALRKQLEKTLLQIPPPKPPPPEMSFIPNPNQVDFLYEVGLDYCVQRLVEQQGRKRERERKKERAQSVHMSASKRAEIEAKPEPVKVPEVADALPGDPIECAQCATDFTPCWRMGETKSGKTKSVMCEACLRSNQKRALKAEHTNRLKQAFVKALQQEQEIEQQIQSGQLTISTPSQSRSPKPPATQQASTKIGGLHNSTSASPLAGGGGTVGVISGGSSSGVSRAGGNTSSSNNTDSTTATAAALIANANNAANAAAAGFGLAAAGLTPQMLASMTAPGLSFNPLFAAAARLSGTAAAAATPRISIPSTPSLNLGSLSKDLLKNLQQMQQQSTTAAQMAMYRKLLAAATPGASSNWSTQQQQPK